MNYDLHAVLIKKLDKSTSHGKGNYSVGCSAHTDSVVQPLKGSESCFPSYHKVIIPEMRFFELARICLSLSFSSRVWVLNAR